MCIAFEWDVGGLPISVAKQPFLGCSKRTPAPCAIMSEVNGDGSLLGTTWYDQFAYCIKMMHNEYVWSTIIVSSLYYHNVVLSCLVYENGWGECAGVICILMEDRGWGWGAISALWHDGTNRILRCGSKGGECYLMLLYYIFYACLSWSKVTVPKKPQNWVFPN